MSLAPSSIKEESVCVWGGVGWGGGGRGVVGGGGGGRLRTVPTFVTAHTFCAYQDTWVSYMVGARQGYFCAEFKTMRRKENLASAFGIQKENWG